jgi:hypothetical protein
VKSKFIVEYWKLTKGGSVTLRAEVIGRENYLTFEPNSLESMPEFILQEIACMEDLPLDSVEIEFREVSKV